MKKINFLTRDKNINRGSYRIWVHELSEAINKTGIATCQIFTDINDIEADCDTIILDKSLYRSAPEVKRKFNDKKVGAINVDSDYQSNDIDYVIVGSIEEYTSLSFYKNVFIVDLIEDKFMNIDRKIHKEKDEIIIGYHGHHPHLFKFFPFLKGAIEKFSIDEKVKLKIIIGDKNFKWNVGKPDIQDIEVYYYEDIEVSDVIKTFDIGVVPNVIDLRIFENFKGISEFKNLELGMNTTDYFIRYKNKTNPGRSYVFYQHGIPVIHDMSPSSYAFMQETGLYSCAHDEASWLKELIKFKNHNIRNKYSKAYYETFHKRFSVENRVKNLLKDIDSIL